MMATNTTPAEEELEILEEYSDTDLDEDGESIASLETDDGQDHLPERILAQVTYSGHTWYLIKWDNCPLLRSSWEGIELLRGCDWILEDWKVEKEKQLRGEKKALDIAAFEKAIVNVELAERRRRTLRRLKRKIARVLSIVSD